MALAAELGWRGVGCELIEQGDGAITTPKMNEVNVRTMEFCRRWGIAEQVLNCPFPADYPFDVAFVTSLSGHEIARMRRPSRSMQRPEPYSPMRMQACSQMWFDPMLRALAQSSATVRLRHRTRLEKFEDTEAGVACDIVDLATGVRERVQADYLVGCDGATSAIRGALGIGLTGDILGHPLHLFFRAPDLLKQCGREPGTFFLAIDREGLWANVRVIDPANAMWRLMVLDSDGKQTPETVDKAALLAGFGRDHVRLVPADAAFAMRPDALADGIVRFFADDLGQRMRPAIAQLKREHSWETLAGHVIELADALKPGRGWR